MWQSPRRPPCSWRKRTDAESPLGTPLAAHSSAGAHPRPPLEANTTTVKGQRREAGWKRQEGTRRGVRPGAGESRAQQRRRGTVPGHGLLQRCCCCCSAAARGYLSASPPSSMTEALPAGPCPVPLAQGLQESLLSEPSRSWLSPGSPEPSTPALQGAQCPRGDGSRGWHRSCSCANVTRWQTPPLQPVLPSWQVLPWSTACQ